MATIEIDEHWRIVGTEYSWEVQRVKRIATGTEADKRAGRSAGDRVWEAISFHSTLGKGLAWLASRRVRTCDAQTIEELEAETRRQCQRIDELLKLHDAA